MASLRALCTIAMFAHSIIYCTMVSDVAAQQGIVLKVTIARVHMYTCHVRVCTLYMPSKAGQHTGASFTFLYIYDHPPPPPPPPLVDACLLLSDHRAGMVPKYYTEEAVRSEVSPTRVDLPSKFGVSLM